MTNVKNNQNQKPSSNPTQSRKSNSIGERKPPKSNPPQSPGKSSGK
ncbi:hypothetical protein [Anaerorhabdus sp.]